MLAAVPDGAGFDEAAALPLVAITATEAMIERMAIWPGELVLVRAGAGGPGHMAIQIARIEGVRAATTVSSP